MQVTSAKLFVCLFQIDELHTRHQAIFTAGELASIAGIRDNIAASITWNNEYAQVVDDWFQDNYGDGSDGPGDSGEEGSGGEGSGEDGDGGGEDPAGGGAASLVSGLVILISFVATFFNH